MNDEYIYDGKVMLKSQFVEVLGVCTRTLANYLNVRYFEELNENYNYYKNQKLLLPNQIKYLMRNLM